MMPRLARYAPGATLLLAMLGATVASAQDENDRLARDAMRRAWHEQRVGASGMMRPGMMFDLWQQMNNLPVAQADQAWRSVGPSGLWLNQENFGGVYGGEMKSGRVNTVAFHPNDPRSMVIASMGGIWRTGDGGTNWLAMTDRQCTVAMGDVIVDPVNPLIMYAATGDGNGRVLPGCGVLKSTDAGVTWSVPQVGPLLDTFIYQIAIDPGTAGSATNSTLVAATTGGLFVSFNSGTTWSLRVPGTATAVTADATRPGVFFASVNQPFTFPRTTMWRSANGGLSWNPTQTPLPSASIDARMELAVSPAAPGMVFVLAGDFVSRRAIGLYRYNDATTQWTRLNANGVVTSGDAYPYTFGEQAEFDLVIGVDPRNANRIWIAGVGAFRSLDGGATFQVTAQNIHVDWHSIAFSPSDPETMAAGTDGGVYLSHDGGRTWRAQNRGLAISQVYQGMSVHPSGLWVYAGLQDNSAIYYSGSTVWSNLSMLGDGGYTAVNRSEPSTVWVTHSFSNFVMRQARGVKEESRANGINFQDRAGVPRPIVMDPTSSATLYFGTQRLYRTTNEGLLWSAITADMSRGSGFITAIAIAPTDARTVWVGTSDGVLSVTRDAGFTWQQLVFGTPRNFTKILIDPLDPLHVIASASTIGAPRITETRDGGATFIAALGINLPDVPVHSVLQVPGTNMVLAATDFGVVQTNNGGGTWAQAANGLPSVIVHDLAYAPNTGTVFAGTFGRGVWAFRPGTTPPVLRGDVNKDGRLTAQDALLIQQALVGLELAPGISMWPEGDANCDNQLTVLDALFVLRSAVGLPTGNSCVGTSARVTARTGPIQHEDVAVRREVRGVGLALK